MFKTEIGKLEESEQAGVMQIVTSWMEQGIERGAEQEAQSLILRQLTRRVGILSSETRSASATKVVRRLNLYPFPRLSLWVRLFWTLRVLRI
jgi:Domain of unknown function (DUF4351)